MFADGNLEMLFDEFGLDFAAWEEEHQGYESWTDQAIYAALPKDIQVYLLDSDVHASWMDDFIL